MTSLERTFVPCDCGCSVAIVVTLQEWGPDPRQSWVEFGLTSHPRLRDRAKDAWAVFRARDPWLHCVALSHSSLRELRDALTAGIPDD